MRCTQNWVWGKLFPYSPDLADVGFQILNTSPGGEATPTTSSVQVLNFELERSDRDY